MTSWSFCTTASETLYITASELETDPGEIRGYRPLAPGEQAMLKRQHLVEFHTELQARSRYKVGKEREERDSFK